MIDEWKYPASGELPESTDLVICLTEILYGGGYWLGYYLDGYWTRDGDTEGCEPEPTRWASLAERRADGWRSVNTISFEDPPDDREILVVVQQDDYRSTTSATITTSVDFDGLPYSGVAPVDAIVTYDGEFLPGDNYTKDGMQIICWMPLPQPPEERS